jgi:hypothetical protein
MELYEFTFKVDMATEANSYDEAKDSLIDILNEVGYDVELVD